MNRMMTADRRRPLRAVAAGAAGAALAAGAMWAFGNAASPAAAQVPTVGGVTLSAGQLLINQRISQAAVRRSNEALALLDPIRPRPAQPGRVLGWRTEDLREAAVATDTIADAAVTTGKLADQAVTTDKLADAAVTTPKLADAAVTTPKIAPNAVDGTRLAPASVDQQHLAPAVANRQVEWARVNGANGALVSSSPKVVSSVRNAPGTYRVTFAADYPIAQCSFSVTQFAAFGISTVVPEVAQNRLVVFTATNAVAIQDRNFMVQSFC